MYIERFLLIAEIFESVTYVDFEMTDSFNIHSQKRVLLKYWICQIFGKYFRRSFSWQYRLSAIYVEFWASWLTLCRLSLEKIPWLPRELRILIYFLSNVGPILFSWKFDTYNFVFCIFHCKCRFFFNISNLPLWLTFQAWKMRIKFKEFLRKS